MDYDLIVVGGGAAGLGAARAGVGRGARTLLVSDGEPGGDCTFHGCVPSKTLIESAARGVPFAAATRRVRDVVAEIAATEDAAALRREGIEVELGRASFTGPGRITVDGRTLTARGFVVATGSAPLVPSIPGLDSVPYLTNETVFDLAELPASLAVLGGGSIGCELAQAFARFGSEVTVVEAASRLLPREDPEASAVLTEVLTREGSTVAAGASVDKVEATGDGVRLLLGDGTSVTAERLLVATGRQPVTERLGLAAAGVQADGRGAVVTDQWLATTARGVYAAGDVTGRLPFTHAAFEMGRIAAANALGRRRRRYRPHATPWVTFTDPEVAHVGHTEAAAARRGRARVAYLPMAEMDRAITAGATDGFVKLVAGPRPVLGDAGGGRLLGATIVASRAGELIHEPALAMATGMFTGRLAAATHAYPTWSYGVQLAAAQFFLPIGGRRARQARAD
ncbi:MAG: NAD(P)/FAD-dependent oxidoreductase [Streptosporangiales bacterium]|nr:NAD(P)/FAD-dependent oxidoreductase [Streptosporangiales bacterium]